MNLDGAVAGEAGGQDLLLHLGGDFDLAHQGGIVGAFAPVAAAALCLAHHPVDGGDGVGHVQGAGEEVDRAVAERGSHCFDIVAQGQRDTGDAQVPAGNGSEQAGA